MPLSSHTSVFLQRWTGSSLCLIILMAVACKAPRNSALSKPTESGLVSWTVKYDRGPCFGECPVYTFYLLNDQRGLLEVKARFLEPGWYVSDLDQELVEGMLLALEPETVWNEDMQDLPEIEELPMMGIVYKHVDGPRWFATQSRITHHFSETFRAMGHMISEGRWSPTDLRPLDPQLVEPLDVIVQLRNDVDIQTWLLKFSHFGIQLKKRVAPRQSYYVVTKDPGKGLSAQFLQEIRSDPDVIGAQWDQPLTRRQD